MTYIIGGGPSGLMTAYELGRRGFRTNVYEEHSKIGEPVQCTGIITSDIYNVCRPDKEVVINKIRKAVIHSPSKSLKINLKDTVIDRAGFDKQLAEMASSVNANINLNKKIKTFPNKDVTIAADGPSSPTRKWLNPREKVRFLTGQQARIKGEFEEDAFHVYLGNNHPGFFGWVVPESSTVARVGTATESNVSNYFNGFLKQLGFSQKNILERNGGVIPMYNPRLKTQYKNTYLVGDAATQVKATTGGGLVPGLKAAKTLAESIEKNTSYERTWRKKIGKELWMHRQLRNTLNKFTDEDYNKALDILAGNKNKKLISRANRDNFLWPMIKLTAQNPKLMGFLPKLLKEEKT